MRIIISTGLLSPYRSDWFNELAKYADVTVCCMATDNAEREESWLSKRPDRCKLIYMKGRTYPKLGKVSKDFIRELKHSSYEIVILDGYGYFNQLYHMTYLNRHRIPYYVNVDGIVPKENESILSLRIKKHFLSKVPKFLCGSRQTNEILFRYGVSKNNIINHPFTSLFETDLYAAPANSIEKESYRRELHINEDKVILSVGRFSYQGGYGKGYDVILKAASKMDKSFGWYIVGGEPNDEFVKLKEEYHLENLHFVQHLSKEELKKFYRSADVFVLMTVGDAWGLVVNEAMACGLPAITTNMCMAGLDLISDGENGYIVGVGDVDGLINAILRTIEKNGDVSMGTASIQRIQDYTIENLARTHINYFERELTDNENNSKRR